MRQRKITSHCEPPSLRRSMTTLAAASESDGEVRQLVEVKLNVVRAEPARDITATCETIALEYKNNSDDGRIGRDTDDGAAK
jgi:hypothetical protein